MATRTTTRRRKASQTPRTPAQVAQLAQSNPTLALHLAETRTLPDNPLRRVKVACCATWVRDATAQTNEWIWCHTHEDWGRVIEVAQ